MEHQRHPVSTSQWRLDLMIYEGREVFWRLSEQFIRFRGTRLHLRWAADDDQFDDVGIVPVARFHSARPRAIQD